MLKELRSGQRLKERFGVVSITEKKTTAGKPYLVIELCCPEGTITGKVWSEAMGNVVLKVGCVGEIEATVEDYRGALNFNVLNGRVLEGELFDGYVSERPTLVFDIETVGKSFEELDETDQDYLVNNLEKKFEGSEEQLHDRTALYPMWGQVLTIGLWNPFTKKGMVYYLNEKKEDAEEKKVEVKAEDFVYLGFATEKEMIEKFWETAEKYERFVTYNGAGFDWPFLVFRSGMHRVKVPFETKGSTERFLDLAQKIQMGYRSFKLEQVCKAFGISNPKTKEVSGQEVAKLYRAGRLQEIVEYVGRDVMSTGDLYLVWKNYLAGKVVV